MTTLFLSAAAVADYEGLNYRVTKDIQFDGQTYYSIDLFVDVEYSNDRLLMVFGDSTNNLKLSALDGGLYNSANGNDLPHNPVFDDIFGDSLKYDSFVTIGTDVLIEIGGPNVLAFDSTSFNNDDIFVLTDGSWYILPISETIGFPHDELGILIARLTVREDQVIAGSINLVGRNEDEGEIQPWNSIFGETFVFTSESVSSNETVPVLTDKWTNGKNNGDRYGFAIANIGDVNKDGFDDLAIGAPFASEQGALNGQIEVRSGYDDTLLYSIEGQHQGERLGSSIAGAGDINGDNVPDFIAGAPRNSEQGDKAGKAYVFSGIDGSEVAVFFGQNAGDRFGQSVAGGSTLDGNNVPDIAIGAPRYKNKKGAVYLYSVSDGTLIQRLKGKNDGDQFGQSVAMTSDPSRYGRLIVGAPKHDGTDKNAGLVNVFQFNGNSFNTTASIQGKRKKDKLGSAVAGLGDLNGDGVEDFGVGSPNYDSGSKSNVGRCSIYSGKNGSSLWNKNGSHNNEKLGYFIGDAGDINCDGISDVLVGSPKYNASGGKEKAGRLIGFAGDSGLSLQNLVSDQAGSRMGQSAAALGNPYNFTKLALGAWNYTPDVQMGLTGGITYTNYFGCNATSELTEPLADQGRVPGTGPQNNQENVPSGEVGELVELLLRY